MPPTLTIICGPMFAGKTSELIRRTDAYAREHATTPIVIRPSWDHRYQSQQQEIVTHDNTRRPAFAASDAAAVRDLLVSKNLLKTTNSNLSAPTHATALAAIDEAHFFGKDLIAPVLDLIAAGSHAIVAGVEIDHMGNPFEPFPTLLAHADEVIKLASRCHVCNQPARHSQRMTSSSARIEVGGSELYQPRCRSCFRPTGDPRGGAS